MLQEQILAGVMDLLDFSFIMEDKLFITGMCDFIPFSTPWGELQRPQSSLSPPPDREDSGRGNHTPPQVLVMVAEEEATRRRSNDDVVPATESTSHVRSSLQLGSTAQLALSSSMSSSTSSLMNGSCSNLPQVLLDKVNKLH